MTRNLTRSLLLLLALSGFAAGQASAALYGNFMDPTGTVFYNNVEDVNGLYGMPSVSLNSLDFTPTTFDATCSSGCAGNPAPGVATTTDTLTMDIVAIGGQQITQIDINEGLEYTLTAFGAGAFASVTVSSNIFIDIFEVDGASVNGINATYTMDFAPANNFSVFGPSGVEAGIPFTGIANIDIASILAANAVVGDATGVRISFDNTLNAFHSGGGLAQVRKRDQDFVSLTINGGVPVPEPGTALLLLGGLAALAAHRRD